MKYLLKCFALFACLVFSACALIEPATSPITPESNPSGKTLVFQELKPRVAKSTDTMSNDEKVVAERSRARWDAMITANAELLYEFLSPASQKQISFDQYKGGIKFGRWANAKVIDVSCKSEDLCEVQTEVEVRLHLKGAGAKVHQTSVSERWFRSEGKWFFVLN